MNNRSIHTNPRDYIVLLQQCNRSFKFEIIRMILLFYDLVPNAQMQYLISTMDKLSHFDNLHGQFVFLYIIL